MHSPRYNPLRRGSVLPLGVEAHLKIKVTPDLYTSPLPSYPRLVHTEPRHRSDHSEQASDVCCAFPRRSSRLGKRRCRLGSRRASTAPTLCTLAPQAVKTPATQKYSTPPYLYEQGAESPAKKLEATLREQQDYRLFAAHSSLGWSAGERGRFEIKTPFLERENAAPTTAEPQALKGAQAAEKCAAVSPRKAPSVIKTNPPRTQKPVANAKAPAPPKTQAQSWRGPVSVCWMAAFVIALVAMTCAAFGSEDATSFASAGGAQPALHTNTTGDLDVVACHPGIYFDPISDMADDQSSPVLSAGDDLLHRESVCGELGVRCDAGGPTTEAVHANMLRPSAPGLGGFRLSDRHQNATEGLPSPLLASPLGWHVRVTAVDALLEARSATICNNDSGMSSSLAAAKEANLLAGSAKESASLAEQVTATAHMQLRHRTHAAAPSPRSSAFLWAFLHFCPFPAHWAPTLPQLHAAPLNLRPTRSVCGRARRERRTARLDTPCRSRTQAARGCALLSAVLAGRSNGRLPSWPKCHLRRPPCRSDPSASLQTSRGWQATAGWSWPPPTSQRASVATFRHVIWVSRNRLHRRTLWRPTCS